MPNNQELFCNYCKKKTLFFQEPNLLWYCDECGNVLDSVSLEELAEEEMGESLLRCPTCHNIIAISEIITGSVCPICFEELSKEVKMLEYEHSDDESVIQKIKGD